MSAKILLVGELNPHGTDPAMALYPLPEYASGARLAAIMGLSRTEYLRRFERRNLCTGKWSKPEAEAAATALVIGSGAEARFILLGAKVSAAFGLPFEPLQIFKRAVYPVLQAEFLRDERSRVFLILPHPSGRNVFWNDKRHITAARRKVELFTIGADAEEARP